MHKNLRVHLEPLTEADKEQFIRDNQEAFNYGALQENSQIEHVFEEDNQIISRKTIEESIAAGQAYRIVQEDTFVGGLVVQVEGEKGELDILFVSPKAHSRGLGYQAWQAVEQTFPQVKVWQTITPYFEKRNIHFYVNRCGFQIAEYYHAGHPFPDGTNPEKQFPGGMFRFEKIISE